VQVSSEPLAGQPPHADSFPWGAKWLGLGALDFKIIMSQPASLRVSALAEPNRVLPKLMGLPLLYAQRYYDLFDPSTCHGVS
jgi:hypothetical protein